MLQPYCGDEIDRVSKLGDPHSVRAYADEPNGPKVYHFNSLGFRGEEYKASAKFKIFAFGCSNTFGDGLNYEETWTHQFTRILSRRHKLRPRDICLMNFGEVGASNDYISRMVLTQCGATKPDLALILLTGNGRTEGFGDREIPFKIGPWLNFGFFWRRLVYLRMPRARKKFGWEQMKGAARYYKFYSDALGVANKLRNLLLIQSFCSAQNIRCIISCREDYRLHAHSSANNPTFAPLISLIDPTMVCKFTLRREKMKVDRAADGRHPGPKSNQIFANRLMSYYEGQDAASV